MNDQGSLEDRVARVEASVERLEKTVKRLADRLTMVAGGSVERPRAAHEPLAKRPGFMSTEGQEADLGRPPSRPGFTIKPKARTGPERNSQWWLSRIGIGLLLFGVLFLFNYAVDQGWLSPLVRVLMGLVLGGGLIVLGVRLHPTRSWYARALIVGGIVTHFIAAYAAFHWYELVSQYFAIAFLALVTLVALALAMRLNDVSVAVTGAAGALLSPVVLFSSPPSTPLLMSHTTIALTVLSGVFLLRGWRTFIWTAFYIAWGIVLVVAASARDRTDDPQLGWITVGIVAALVAFWFVPLVRERLIAIDPDKWKRPPIKGQAKDIAHLDRHAHVLSVLTPLIAVWAGAAAWELSKTHAGWLALTGAVLAAGVSLIVSRWRAAERLAFSQGAAAVVLLTLGVSLVLEGNALLVALTVEAAALHLIGARTGDEVPLRTGQAMLAAVAFWVFRRFLTMRAGTPAVFNPDAMVDALVIITGVALAPRLEIAREKAGYLVVAHVLLLGWLARELSSLQDGSGLVTLAWGAYGMGLLVYALRRQSGGVQRIAMATLLLVVAKLFLVDLAVLAPVWRIILFMGFGALFLILSYYFQDLWVSESKRVDD